MKDESLLADDAVFQKTKAHGVVRKGKAIQVIIGMNVENMKTEFDKRICCFNETIERIIPNGLLSHDKPEQQEEKGFLAPISGEIIDLDHVPDEAFSQRMMGDGFAIQPENGEVFSPVDGIVTTVVPSKHALSIKSNSGVEFLIHFGVDTVKLKGEGFEVFVKEGSSVKAGDPIFKVGIEQIKDKVPSIVVPIIFIELNGKSFSYKTGKVGAKEIDAVTIQ